MWSLLRGLGLEESVEFAELDPDGYSTLVFPDLTLRVSSGLGRLPSAAARDVPERGARHPPLCLGAAQSG